MNTRIGHALRSAGRKLTVIALAGSLAGAVLAGALDVSAQASTGATWTGRSETIAQLASGGLRATLTAYQTSGGKAPAATVRVAAYHRLDGRWVRYGRPLLVGKRGGWFWNVVTGRFGVQR